MDGPKCVASLTENRGQGLRRIPAAGQIDGSGGLTANLLLAERGGIDGQLVWSLALGMTK